MSGSLFSTSWYRVAEVRPRLRSHAQIHRHVYRGDVWYVLQNHSTGKFHRFGTVANLVIGLMDGKRTLQQIWDLACERLGDEVPTQDELIKLLSDLHRADVLQSDAPPDSRELQHRRKRHALARWKQYIGNPLSLRFPLIDPEPWLARIAPWVAPVAGWAGALLWISFVGWALVLAAMHWTELTGNVVDRVFSMENLLLLWVIYPLIKLLHELGHALATKLGGGEVHEMGIMLLVLMPVPYVDASASTGFRDRRSRMLVGGAGMLVELFLAALAVFAWVYLEPGTERAIAYNIILVAGVSTLLFNGNPLLRYDGYYILSDYLEIPNLAQRSNEYLAYLVNTRVFGVEGAQSPVASPGEAGWFVFYGIGSFVYRMIMMVSIAVLVAGKFFVVGIVLALWALCTMLLLPLGKKVGYLLNSPSLERRRHRAIGITVAVVGALAGTVFYVPLPSATRAEGVIWAPEQAQVRARVDGFIHRVVAQPDAMVSRGELLIECEDPELAARERVLRAQLSELDARYDGLIQTKRVQADVVNEQKKQVAEALLLAQRRQADLQVRSPADGVFIMAETAENALGRFAQRGDILAYVVDRAANTVRVVVPQGEGDLVRKATRRVEIRATDRIGHPVAARVQREVPAATDDLPSMTLSLQGGGKIGIDPNRSGDPKALEKLFVVDLELPRGEQPMFIGGRVYVRFEHDPEPMAEQWYRELRRAFLKRFNV